MGDNADLKIDRATKHIIELNELIRKTPPFSYILETNTLTGQRATFAKQDEPVINRIALMCGDAIQNLRSALDHAYWHIVSTTLPAGTDFKSVQFPFSETLARLDESVKNRLANKVSPSFFKTIIDLKPYGELGGNELLFMIHQLGIIDRHKLLIPTANYQRFSSAQMQLQVPDFPNIAINLGFSKTGRDVVWFGRPWSRAERRRAKVPHSGILEEKLNIPVDIIFDVGKPANFRPMVPTLYQLVDVARAAVAAMRAA